MQKKLHSKNKADYPPFLSVCGRRGGNSFLEVEMDINFIFKIAAIGIITAVLNQVLVRSGKEEHAMIVTIAGLIVVLMMLIPQIGELFSTIKSVCDL